MSRDKSRWSRDTMYSCSSGREDFRYGAAGPGWWLTGRAGSFRCVQSLEISGLADVAPLEVGHGCGNRPPSLGAPWRWSSWLQVLAPPFLWWRPLTNVCIDSYCSLFPLAGTLCLRSSVFIASSRDSKLRDLTGSTTLRLSSGSLLRSSPSTTTSRPLVSSVTNFLSRIREMGLILISSLYGWTMPTGSFLYTILSSVMRWGPGGLTVWGGDLGMFTWMLLSHFSTCRVLSITWPNSQPVGILVRSSVGVVRPFRDGLCFFAPNIPWSQDMIRRRENMHSSEKYVRTFQKVYIQRTSWENYDKICKFNDVDPCNFITLS